MRNKLLFALLIASALLFIPDGATAANNGGGGNLPWEGPLTKLSNSIKGPVAYGMNARQTIAAGMGQQLGQLGQEMSRRNIRIQPTIEIRQGSHFVVMVTKDIIISPWLGNKN